MEVLSNLDLSDGTQINFLGNPDCTGPLGSNAIIKRKDDALTISTGFGLCVHIGSEFEIYNKDNPNHSVLNFSTRHGSGSGYGLCAYHITTSEFIFGGGKILNDITVNGDIKIIDGKLILPDDKLELSEFALGDIAKFSFSCCGVVYLGVVANECSANTNDINIFPYGCGSVNIFGTQIDISDSSEDNKSTIPHIAYNGTEFKMYLSPCNGCTTPVLIQHSDYTGTHFCNKLYADGGLSGAAAEIKSINGTEIKLTGNLISKKVSGSEFEFSKGEIGSICFNACNGSYSSNIFMCNGHIQTKDLSAVQGIFAKVHAGSEISVATIPENKSTRLMTILQRGNETTKTTIALDIDQTNLWNKTEFLVTKTQLDEALDNLEPAGPTVNHLEFTSPTIPANCSLYEVSLSPTVFTKTPIMQLTNKSGAAQVADLCYNKTSNKVFVGIEHDTQIAAGEYKLSVFGM